MGLDYNKIGNRIRATRRGKHISQDKMAEALYSNQNQISLLESAKSGAISDLKVLESVCQYLEINLQELLFMEDFKFMLKYDKLEVERRKQEDEKECARIEKMTNSTLYQNALNSIDQFAKYAEEEGKITLKECEYDYTTGKEVDFSEHIVTIRRMSDQEYLELIEQEISNGSEYWLSKEGQEEYKMQRVYAKIQNEEIKEFLDSGEIENEEEYFWGICENDFIILDQEEIEDIAEFFYNQSFDTKEFALTQIINASIDGVLMQFSNSGKDATSYKEFFIYYNKEDNTCEVYKEVLESKKSDIEIITTYEPAESLQDAIENNFVKINKFAPVFYE